MTDTDTSDDLDLFKFPCEFPIKAMGKAHPDFEGEVIRIVRKHCPDLKENAVHCNESKGGNYLAITVTIMAQSREQLDAIYQDLTDSDYVKMAL